MVERERHIEDEGNLVRIEPRQRSLFGEPIPLPVAPPAPLRRFYMTADLRAATGVPRTAMDFYLRAGVILPTARTESGYLLFDDSELALLRQVIEWRSRGIGLKAIKARLNR
jgi:MerR-like DNA binding protein